MTNPNKKFKAQGKLLLSGEYAVLDGAKALALPSKYGQELYVEPFLSESNTLLWHSIDSEDHCWFEAKFNTVNFDIHESNEPAVAERLSNILKMARILSPNFLRDAQDYHVKTILGFPRDWGLGSSSTLLSLVAQWANADAFRLSDLTFGGSGYDIACASQQGPIVYQRQNNQARFHASSFNPAFKQMLWFVWQGKKQDSREGISHYKKLDLASKQTLVDALTRCTDNLLVPTLHFNEFEAILKEHETIVSTMLNLPKVQDLYFSDYWGQTKSLGAWGGDFILATSLRSETETKAYFHEKGFDVVMNYGQMIL